MCQNYVQGFTSSNLTMVAQAFDFMANLNIDYCMSKDATNRTSGTQVSLSTSFLRWQKIALITSKCFLKLSIALDYNIIMGIPHLDCP